MKYALLLAGTIGSIMNFAHQGYASPVTPFWTFDEIVQLTDRKTFKCRANESAIALGDSKYQTPTEMRLEFFNEELASPIQQYRSNLRVKFKPENSSNYLAVDLDQICEVVTFGNRRERKERAVMYLVDSRKHRHGFQLPEVAIAIEPNGTISEIKLTDYYLPKSDAPGMDIKGSPYVHRVSCIPE